MNEFSDAYEITLFAGTNPDSPLKQIDSWNSTIIPESDLILFIAAINNDEETIRTELQKSIELYSHITRNILREVVFIYHNNQFNPNHTNDLKQNEWQKKLN